MRALALLPVSWWLLAASSPLHAGTATGTLEVSFSVLPACAVSAAPLAFVAPAGAAAEAEAQIVVRCTAETAVEVSLGRGLHGTATGRRLANANGAAVPYAIYRDPARTRPWEAAGIVAGAAPGRALILTAYGRIEPADSAVPAGDYRDSVIITVDF